MVTQPLTRNLLLLLFQNSLSVVESHPTIVAERPVQGIQEVYRYAILPLSHGAGWSSSVARRAHNPKVTGSNPVPATIEKARFSGPFSLVARGRSLAQAGVADRLPSTPSTAAVGVGRLNSPSIQLAASRSIPSRTCEYVSKVRPTVAWPKRSDTTLGWMFC